MRNPLGVYETNNKVKKTWVISVKLHLKTQHFQLQFLQFIYQFRVCAAKTQVKSVQFGKTLDLGAYLVIRLSLSQAEQYLDF